MIYVFRGRYILDITLDTSDTSDPHLKRVYAIYQIYGFENM